MFILLGIFLSFALTLAEIRLFPVSKSSRWRMGLKNALLVTVFSIAVMKYIFGFPRFLLARQYGVIGAALFIGVGTAVGLSVLGVKALIVKKMAFLAEKPEKERKKTSLKVTAVVLFMLGCLIIFLTQWAIAEFGNLSADQLLFLMFSPAAGTPAADIINAFEGPVFLSTLLTTVFGLFVFSDFRLVVHFKAKETTVFNDFIHRIVSICAASVLLVGGLIYAMDRFHVPAIIGSYLNTSDIIDSHFVDPHDANLRFPEKKRNLIHIYLESVENSYMSKELGGFMHVDMIPELTQLAREGYSFSHLDHQFGGPTPAIGTTWSVASMVNMSTGLPMKAPNNPNDYGTPGNFLPGAYALGDILAEQGYEQTLMFGADADFGGLTYFYQTHGDFKIMDYKYAKKNGLIPPNYLVWWGFEDDKLFEFAKDEITRLSQTGKPFNFTMETADTHRPDGYLSPLASTPHENQYANVVSYSSQEVYKFVRWIQEQPFYENTTVIIIGDHLSMESNFFKFYNFDDSFQRSQYNVILNPDPSVATRDKDILFNRVWANFDMFPTILSSLGVQYDGSRLGIGTDLFSGDKTLFEELGVEYVNQELEKGSPLFNSQILRKPQKP